MPSPTITGTSSIYSDGVSTSQNISAPPNSAAGDLLLMCIGWYFYSITIPTGWTVLGSYNVANRYFSVLYRTDNDPGPWTISSAGLLYTGFSACAVRVAGSTNDVTNYAESQLNGYGTIATPSLTTSVGNNLLLYFGFDGGTNDTISVPSDCTDNINISATANIYSTDVCSKSAATATTYSADNYNLATNYWMCVGLALPPAGGSFTWFDLAQIPPLTRSQPVPVPVS